MLCGRKACAEVAESAAPIIDVPGWIVSDARRKIVQGADCGCRCQPYRLASAVGMCHNYFRWRRESMNLLDKGNRTGSPGEPHTTRRWF